jgi:hypothetical protein
MTALLVLRNKAIKPLLAAARGRAFSKQSPCQYGPRHAAYDLKKLRGKCLPGMRYRWVANGARKGPRRVLMETPVARLVSR